MNQQRAGKALGPLSPVHLGHAQAISCNGASVEQIMAVISAPLKRTKLKANQFTAAMLGKRLGRTRHLILRRAQDEQWPFELLWLMAEAHKKPAKVFLLNDLPPEYQWALKRGCFLDAMPADHRRAFRDARPGKTITQLEAELQRLDRQRAFLLNRLDELRRTMP